MGFWPRKRVAVVVVLVIAALALPVAYLGILWHLARHAGAPDREVPLLEPPERPAPSRGVPLFRTVRIGDRFEVVDDQGRVVVLRGAYAATSQPPYRPFPLGDEEPFQRLRTFGFNTIVLPVPWEVLEPAPRVVGLEHLRYMQWFLDAAHRNGLLVIVENVLRGASRCLGGKGAPAWAHRPGLVSEDGCVKAKHFLTWPRRLRWWADFYDASWTLDDLALQDHLIWAFVKVAEVLQNHPALLGYGIGSGMPCEREGLAAMFYAGTTPCDVALSDFFRRFARAIRAVDADALVFFQGPETFDGRGPSRVIIEAPPVQGRAWAVPARSLSGFCGLDICPGWEDLEVLPSIAAARYEAPVVLTEIEAPSKETVVSASQRMVDVEKARISILFTTYSTTNVRCDIPNLVVAEGCGEARAGTPRCATGVLVRPAPMRVGGIPLKWGFSRFFGDRDHVLTTEGSDTFTLVFRQREAYADTWIYVPRRLLYNEDPATEAPEFTVHVSDGRWRWAEWDDQVLVFIPDPEVPEHRLVIKPWGGGPAPGNGVGACVEDGDQL